MITLEQTIEVVNNCKHVAAIGICDSCPYNIYGHDCDERLKEDVVKYLQLLVM